MIMPACAGATADKPDAPLPCYETLTGRAAIRDFTRLPCETENIWKEQVIGAVQGMVEETNRC